MTNLFDGLHLYEIVLLVLGVVLFVALLVALLRLVFQGKPFGGLLAFFALPIVMIAYPSIKSIEIGNDTVTIEKYTSALREDPTNPATRETLKKAVANLTARPIGRADRAITLASAQLALGDERAAVENLRKAQRIDPAAPAALELQKRIDVVHNLDRLTTAVEARPTDPNTKAELSRTLADATKTRFADPNALASIARAQTAVGDHKLAIESAEKALAIDPKLQVARDVKIRATAATTASVPH